MNTIMRVLGLRQEQPPQHVIAFQEAKRRLDNELEPDVIGDTIGDLRAIGERSRRKKRQLLP